MTAGFVTVVVGIIAPVYGLLTAVVALVVAYIVAAVGGTRRDGQVGGPEHQPLSEH